MTWMLKNGAIFLHVPKTGGDWVGKVIEANDLGGQSCFHKHATFDRVMINDPTEFDNRNWPRLAAPPDDGTFYFCFVRHPVDWYVSWWRYVHDVGNRQFGDVGVRLRWHPCAVLNGLWHSDFDRFVDNVISARPGYVTELYMEYAKPGVHVGKTETIIADLWVALVVAGFVLDGMDIANVPPENVSMHPRPELKEETIKAIEDVEHTAMVRFGYKSKLEVQDAQ